MAKQVWLPQRTRRIETFFVLTEIRRTVEPVVPPRQRLFSVQTTILILISTLVFQKEILSNREAALIPSCRGTARPARARPQPPPAATRRGGSAPRGRGRGLATAAGATGRATATAGGAGPRATRAPPTPGRTRTAATRGGGRTREARSRGWRRSKGESKFVFVSTR